MTLSSGKLVHFDVGRGFGFVAPDAGGEDVFIHVNDFENQVVDERRLKPGATLEFEVERGGRGLKATNVRLVEGALAGEGEPPSDSVDHLHKVKVQESQETKVTVNQGADPEQSRSAQNVMILSAEAFALEITEILLDSSSSLTASQVLTIRRRFAEFAQARGWVRDE